jgi:DNA invertase Pin-like site-specific DNA recombinase
MSKAVYIRTSTEDQEPENQIREIETISGKEYVLFQDKQSAWKDDKEREGFDRLKKEIQSNKIRDLYCWDWDRLFRNRKKLKEFFLFCAMYKCNIHSFRQAFYEDFYKIPSPFNEIVQNIVLDLLGWIAEDESDKKSKRVKAALRNNNGVTTSYKGNKWGYHGVGEEADKQIIELHKQGKTQRQIAKEVFYWNKNRNKKFVSLGYVNKLLLVHKLASNSASDGNRETKVQDLVNI